MLPRYPTPNRVAYSTLETRSSQCRPCGLPLLFRSGRAPFVEEARARGELYISQAYDLYSKENHEAWRQLFARIRPKWERYANPHFLDGVAALDLPNDHIPRLSEINRRLEPLTGFQAKAVSGYVP